MRLGIALPIVGGVIVVVSLIATANSQQLNTEGRMYWVVIICLLLLGIQTWANFARQWYDPVLAFKYIDLFFGDGFEKKRAKACKHFLSHKEWNDEIEDILDVLDDLGFYLQTIHISRDVVHHYFYWWIRGYVVLAQPYIAKKRVENGGEPGDSLRWIHCDFLLREVAKVEKKQLRKSLAVVQCIEWDDNQKSRFLKEEAALEG